MKYNGLLLNVTLALSTLNCNPVGTKKHYSFNLPNIDEWTLLVAYWSHGILYSFIFHYHGFANLTDLFTHLHVGDLYTEKYTLHKLYRSSRTQGLLSPLDLWPNFQAQADSLHSLHCPLRPSLMARLLGPWTQPVPEW